jgi:hypothetical protein
MIQQYFCSSLELSVHTDFHSFCTANATSLKQVAREKLLFELNQSLSKLSPEKPEDEIVKTCESLVFNILFLFSCFHSNYLFIFSNFVVRSCFAERDS